MPLSRVDGEVVSDKDGRDERRWVRECLVAKDELTATATAATESINRDGSDGVNQPVVRAPAVRPASPTGRPNPLHPTCASCSNFQLYDMHCILRKHVA